ncbi:MAG: hypothetical protein JNL57_07525 [Bacteroidetes bacterium]|nr:hypothetical protein [Bacteroidota bacterium]
MNNIITYFRQRYSGIIFWLLPVYILLFAFAPLVKTGSWQVDWLYLCIVLWVALLALRLFDDLSSSEKDTGKPDRDYTHAHGRKKLYAFVYILHLAVFVFCFVTGKLFWAGYAVFILINEVLYLLGKIWPPGMPVLALLKYPFFIIWLEHSFTPHALLIFLAFVFYEIAEDPAFPLGKAWGWLCLAGITGLQVAGDPSHAIYYLPLGAGIALLYFTGVKYFEYMMLLWVLGVKIWL